MMQTFDPTSNMPNFIKALDVVSEISARETSFRLPMLGKLATAKPMTGKTDLRLKTVRTNMQHFNKILDEVIFDHITIEDEEFINLDDFMRKMTLPDINILTALLLDASYTTLPAREIYCPECESVSEYKVKMSEILGNPNNDIVEWDHKEPVYEKVFSKTIADGVVTVYIKMVTEASRADVLRYISNDTARQNLLKKNGVLDSTDTLLTFIEKIEVVGKDESGKKQAIELTNRHVDIRGFLENCPLAIHEEIKEFLNETLGKYKADLKIPVTCKNCGHKFDADFDPMLEFFRNAVLNI